MKCPACLSDKISPWLVWIATPYWNIQCPGCGSVFKPEKTGIARFSTCLLALLAGIMIVSGIFSFYWNTMLFLAICVVTLTLDYFTDMKYIQLSSKDKTEQTRG